MRYAAARPFEVDLLFRERSLFRQPSDALTVFVGECDAGLALGVNMQFDAVPAGLIEQHQRR
jgi:hypothetical protein